MVMKKPVYVKQSQKYMTVRTTSVHKIPGTFALQIGGKKEEVVRRGVNCVAKHVEYEIKCGDLRKKIGEICSHSLRGLCGLKSLWLTYPACTVPSHSLRGLCGLKSK